MLVLSRKESERIRIGESIVVTVVREARDRVRIGIEAPDDVLVLRDELEKNPQEAAHTQAATPAAPTRTPVERRTLADFRRQRNTSSSDTPSAEMVEEMLGKTALAEEDTEAEDRGSNPMRRFFRW